MVMNLRELVDRQRRNLIKTVEAASSTSRRRHKKRRPPRNIVDAPFVRALLIATLFFGFVTIATYEYITSGSEHRVASATNGSPPSGLAAAVTASIRQRLRRSPPNPRALIEKLQHTFPLHVTEETTEVIDHPALPYIMQDFPPHHDDYYDDNGNEGSAFSKGLTVNAVFPNGTSTMRAPVMFDQAYGHIYGSERIRSYLGDFGRRLITPEEAKSIGSFDKDGHETLYVSIASYRDWECPKTVSDMYERAEFPERIRVAIVEQRKPDDDMICNKPEQDCETHPEQPLCKYAHLIEYFEMDSTFGVGPVFARHIAHRYYRGEYFAMQVDAHVRFVEHWDSSLVEQWKAANNEMAVLTTYMSDITDSIDPVTHASKRKARPIMCDSIFEDKGAWRHMRHNQEPEEMAKIKGEPMLHPFWAAGFSFARGHFIIQVPYDHFLPMVFQGEEISLTVRGFTYGYDYYAPEKSIAFHMYKHKSNDRGKIHKFTENRNRFSNCLLPATMRLNNLIRMTNWTEEKWVQNDKDLYGVGQVRTAEKYYATFGIHVDETRTERHLCDYVTKHMHAEFKPFLRNNSMGLDYDQVTLEYTDPWPDQKDDDNTGVV